VSTRKVHQAPAFTRISNPAELKRILMEIEKMRPPFEVSLENHGGLAQGRIRHWDAGKKLFSVQWSKAQESFFSACGERTGLRSFFKVKLFTTQLIFRTELIRRLPEGEFQYRIPRDFFQSQLRKSLRLPIPKGRAFLRSDQGTFPVLDLSTSGARIGISDQASSGISVLNSCILILGQKQITTPELTFSITHRSESSAGGRFRGLNESLQISIKQYLIDTLYDLVKGGRP
jgi:hypothetical protein